MTNAGTISGGTFYGKVICEAGAVISGGTFKQAVTITRYDDTNTGTCSISGGTFKDKLTLYRSKSKLSALLADELWSLVGATANPQAAGFVLEMVKTIRGLGGIAVTSTQGMQDLFGLEGGSYGKGILDASRIKLVMQMEEQEARLIQDTAGFPAISSPAIPVALISCRTVPTAPPASAPKRSWPSIWSLEAPMRSRGCCWGVSRIIRMTRTNTRPT